MENQFSSAVVEALFVTTPYLSRLCCVRLEMPLHTVAVISHLIRLGPLILPTHFANHYLGQ